MVNALECALTQTTLQLEMLSMFAPAVMTLTATCVHNCRLHWPPSETTLSHNASNVNLGSTWILTLLSVSQFCLHVLLVLTTVLICRIVCLVLFTVSSASKLSVLLVNLEKHWIMVCVLIHAHRLKFLL